MMVNTVIKAGSDALENSYEASWDIAPYTQAAMDVNKTFNPLYWAFDYATEQGWFTGAFDKGGFYMDANGIYHAKQSGSVQSEEATGYNNGYDAIFNCATSMNKDNYKFTSNGVEYVIWAWKGDYLNLGAGAEMGIYERLEVDGNPTSHWLVNQDLAMPMTLTVDYKGNQIISYDPKIDDKFDKEGQGIDKWWVTGFDPKLENVNAADLTATFTVDFSGKTNLYDDFVKSDDYLNNTDIWSVSEDNKYLLTLTLEMEE